MEIIEYSDFRNQISCTFDRVNEKHIPILIRRVNGKDVIIMSFEEFKSYVETSYLMASPKNAERLNQAIAEEESRNITGKEHIEE
ncbi:Antitoxin YefM [Chlamydiales bacterium SCGC AG-110-M15]|nr:Antitoxin YefM [Chlamydiales bacterium SCGC AG-110-M15]